MIRLSENDRKQLAQVKEIIENHSQEYHTLKSLSLKAGFNRNKLSYGFKKSFGISIHQYLIKIRMKNARKLLLETDTPIKSIASQQGYSNTENFIHAFKKYNGHTPTVLRKYRIK